MNVALRSPQLVGALIPVDNAPVDANLKSDFHKYVQGMWDIEEAHVKTQAEADDVLKKYEKVGRPKPDPCLIQHKSYTVSLFLFANFSSPILSGLRMENDYGFVSLSRSSLRVSTKWAVSHSTTPMRFATTVKHSLSAVHKVTTWQMMCYL